MIFADIPAGSAVFLDANTLVYAIMAHSAFATACTELLDRIENQDLQGFTSSAAVSETVHKAMTFEACDRFGWPAQGVASRLRRHPNEVRQLLAPRRAV